MALSLTLSLGTQWGWGVFCHARWQILFCFGQHNIISNIIVFHPVVSTTTDSIADLAKVHSFVFMGHVSSTIKWRYKELQTFGAINVHTTQCCCKGHMSIHHHRPPVTFVSFLRWSVIRSSVIPGMCPSGIWQNIIFREFHCGVDWVACLLAFFS